MIKEAIEYLLALGKPHLIEENGEKWLNKPSDELTKLIEPTANTIEINTLKGIVDYVNSNFDGGEDLLLHILSPTVVELVSGLNSNKRRTKYLRSEALKPHIRFDSFYDSEEFNILLQSAFVKNEDRDVLLQVVGNIREEKIGTTGDDGTSQTVTVKTGVATVSTVVVPNPATLAPRRTFVDIVQPESEFVFRMKDGPRCALFEADGGRWKNEAMDNIRQYFEEQLDQQIRAGRITIIS